MTRKFRLVGSVFAAVVAVIGAALVTATLALDERAVQHAASRATTTEAPSRNPVPLPFPGSLRTFLSTRQETRLDAQVLNLATGQTYVFQSPSPGSQVEASVVKLDILATSLWQSKGAVPMRDVGALTSMIEQSNNDAATNLWIDVGAPNGIGQLNRLLGMNSTDLSQCVQCPGFPWPGWGLSTTTAADQIQLMKVFALPNHVLDDAQRSFAIGLMQHVEPDQAWGVSSGVPAGVAVTLKDGWLPLSGDSDWSINSVGWVDGGGRDYLIAVLTSGNPSMDYGIETIQAISQAAWNLLAP
jgi:Beta-lactamase enzyme family